MVALGIAYNAIWNKAGGMDLHDMEIACGIRKANSMTTLAAFEMDIIDGLMDVRVCPHEDISKVSIDVSTCSSVFPIEKPEILDARSHFGLKC